jgi:hypothetical protein
MSSCLKGLRAALLALAVCGGAGFVGGGCAQQKPAAPPVQPMEIDAAMQRRDWERSVAWYPNGDTVAGVNRFPLRSYGDNHGDADYTNAGLDLLASLGQTVALPFTYLFVPPFEAQVFGDQTIPATHTAMPFMRPVVDTPEGPKTVARAEELERLESPEPLPKPEPERQPSRDPRRGPQGPGDSDFMSSPPSPAREWE